LNSKYLPDGKFPIVQNYKQAEEYIFSQLPMFHRIGAAAYKNNLDGTIALSKLCGKPELKFPSIHIAGTNGKGSVANMLASILQEAGYKTGLFTSPHLKDFRERLRVNGEMIPKQRVVAFIAKHQTNFETLQPSFFELSFAMAMQYFADQKVDIAVVETGMGGRLDSTNIVRPILSIITNISYDHMQFLGNTLQKIAVEKSGIIKPNVDVLIGKSQVETQEIFINTAKNLKSQIKFADKVYKTANFNFSHIKPYGSVFTMLKNGAPLHKDCYSPLSGYYQKENLQTIFAAVDILRKQDYNINDFALFDGIGNVTRNTGLKGRWQVLHRNPLTICDTAHNEAGIASALAQIATLNFKKLHFVIGMVEDKDIKKILSFLPKNAVYYFCKPNIPRGLNQNTLAKRASGFDLQGKSYETVKEAYRAASAAANFDDLVFVGGSTFVVAEVV
jgi:dihydrofolate synthase/folylpolyglutamate synthase